MTFKDYTKMYLVEGIQYFKYSKKFLKLVNRLEKDINLAEDKEEAEDFILKLKEAAKDFEVAEEEYKTSKYDGMMKYKILKSQYKDIVKMAKKDTIKNFILAIGGLGILGNIIYFLEKKW